MNWSENLFMYLVFRLHLFYHQGECLILNLRQGTSPLYADEMLSEIVSRLKAVTHGAESQVSLFNWMRNFIIY